MGLKNKINERIKKIILHPSSVGLISVKYLYHYLPEETGKYMWKWDGVILLSETNWKE
jgi:hypothetical protein